MKYIKLFESMTDMEVAKICKKYGIVNWSINKDGLVDVDGDVDLTYRRLTKLPLYFGKVNGNFLCDHNDLTTLEGAPKEVGGGFYCYKNNLTTLEGGPQEVVGDFYCQRNNLTTLKGGPQEVVGDFYCSYNNLTTLEGAPTEVGGNFYCDDNELTTLKGSPQEVNGDFFCYYNNLTTLKWAPEYIDDRVDFLPNGNLPTEFIGFLELNSNRGDLQKYILKWQKDYAIWRRDGSFSQLNFILMMESAQDELKNLEFPE